MDRVRARNRVRVMTGVVKEILVSSPEFDRDLLRLSSSVSDGKISFAYATAAIDAIHFVSRMRRAGGTVDAGPYGILGQP